MIRLLIVTFFTMVYSHNIEPYNYLIPNNTNTLGDINDDGVVDTADTALLDAGDDFGFNEGIELL